MLIFMVWLSWTPGSSGAPAFADVGRWVPLFGSLALLILLVGLWSRKAALRLTGRSLSRDMRRFNRLMRLSRMLIPAWFAVAVYLGDWPQVVHRATTGLRGLPLESPRFFLGTLPPLLAWVALWWAFYPIEKVFREQTLLEKLEANLPVCATPTFKQYLVANFRLQLLFLYAPVLCILSFRDVLVLGCYLGDVKLTQGLQLLVAMGAMLPVLLLSPVMLVRILPTDVLAASPLRQRLLALCGRQGIKVSNILLWRTQSSIGNAAVMGILPRIRYLLVTDLTLETMPEEQILAVFAHEVGHIAHGHLLWMAACAFGFFFAATGPGESLWNLFGVYIPFGEPYLSLLTLAISAPVFLLIFGLVARRLERQADVFAARMIPQLLDREPAELANNTSAMVTRHGALIVGAALQRIATINNVSIYAHEWLHGSIVSRMDYLMELADDPGRTRLFDRQMFRLFALIFSLLVIFGAWTLWVLYS